jgi:adhesin/invasin
VATGVSAGQTTVTATSGNRTGTAVVCVVGPLVVTPQSLSIVAARTSQLSVANAAGATLSFASNAPGVATVDAAGLVRGVSIGQATITTTLTGGSGSVTATTPVTVTAGSVAVSPTSATVPINGIARFTSVVRDADGVALPGAVSTWTISDPTIGTLSTTSGITLDVRGLKVGSATVRATAGGATASASFTATTPLPAARLEKVSGDGTACPTQSTSCTFVVRAVDANGVPVPGAQIAWSALPTCAPPRFATTDASGLATSSNICSAPAGTYTQIATLQTNQQQVSFSFSLRGVVLSLQSVDSSGISTYGVTSGTSVASGLSVEVKYQSGPVDGYLTVLELNRTVTPALLSVAFDSFNLPPGDYEFDLIVSTTTPGIGPGVATVSFSNSFNFFTEPNARRRPLPTRIFVAPSAP